MWRREVRTVARGLRRGGELETREIPGGADGPLVRNGLLVRSGRLDGWPSDDGFVPVFQDARAGYYYCDESGTHHLRDEDVLLWRSDFRAVAERLQELFGCRGPLSEVVPGRLLSLGASDLPIGRRPARSGYFADWIENGNDPILGGIRENEDFVLVAGFADYAVFDGRFATRAFCMDKVCAAEEPGVWSLRKEVMDMRFGAPAQPAHRKPNTAKQDELLRVARVLKDWCFAYRDKWDALLEIRESVRTQKGLSEATGIKRSTGNAYFGDGARAAGENPLVFFWWDTLLDRHEMFALFEAFLDQDFVRHDIPRFQKMPPDVLKEQIDKFKIAKAIAYKTRRTR